MLKHVGLVVGVLALVYATPVISEEKLREFKTLDGPYTEQVLLGKKIYKRCTGCHSTTKNKIGPSLENLFGRTAGTVEGYRYSKAMRKSGIVWNEETLKKFLKKPRKYIRGTRMRFSGIRKENQLDGLIAYLKLKLRLEAMKVE
jgi:cytochrome c